MNGTAYCHKPVSQTSGHLRGENLTKAPKHFQRDSIHRTSMRKDWAFAIRLAKAGCPSVRLYERRAMTLIVNGVFPYGRRPSRSCAPANEEELNLDSETCSRLSEMDRSGNPKTKNSP